MSTDPRTVFRPPLLALVLGAVLWLVTGVLIGLALAAPADAARAFQLVQGPDLRNPVNVLSAYDVLVCNPELNPDAVRARAKPGAIVLAMVNCRSVPTYGPDSDFYGSLRAAMDDDEWFFLDAEGHRITDADYPTLQILRCDLDAYSRLAEWFGERCAGFDGLYLDDHFAELPARLLSQRGVPDPEIERLRFAHLMGFFVDALREHLPPGALLVGNVGAGWPPPSNLDAVTIEGPHIRTMGAPIALWRFYSYAQIPGHRGDLNVAWSYPMEATGIVARGDER